MRILASMPGLRTTLGLFEATYEKKLKIVRTEVVSGGEILVSPTFSSL